MDHSGLDLDRICAHVVELSGSRLNSSIDMIQRMEPLDIGVVQIPTTERSPCLEPNLTTTKKHRKYDKFERKNNPEPLVRFHSYFRHFC
jgi:hypothetical protein